MTDIPLTPTEEAILNAQRYDDPAIRAAGYNLNGPNQLEDLKHKVYNAAQDRYLASERASKGHDDKTPTITSQGYVTNQGGVLLPQGTQVVAGGASAFQSPILAKEQASVSVPMMASTEAHARSESPSARPSESKVGVFATQQGQLPGGQQVVITQGHPKTAGALITQLQGKPFLPGVLVNPSVNQRLLQRSSAPALEGPRTADVLGMIAEAGAGNFTGPGAKPGEIKPYEQPLIEFIKQDLSKHQYLASQDAARYAQEGGAYFVPAAELKIGEFGIGFYKGAIEEVFNVKSELVALGTGAAFGAGERGIALAAKSTSGTLRASATVVREALPIVNLALVAPYAIERGYHGAEAVSTRGFDGLAEFSGQTITQVATFGLGYGIGKTVVNPIELRVTGLPTSPVTVAARGVQDYTGRGQEVNPGIDPVVVKTTIYTERAEGYLGLLRGDVRTKVTELSGNRYVTRDVGGTVQNPTYRYVSIVKANPELTTNGLPIENVLVYKNGELTKTYQQTAEGFGKVTFIQAPNVFKGTEETLRSTEATPQVPQQEKIVQRYRATSNPDKSIIRQGAGEEKILTLRQETGGKVLEGKIGVSTDARAISFTARAPFEGRVTPIERSITENPLGVVKRTKVERSERVIAGTTKVTLKVTDEPLKNEFTQSRNRLQMISEDVTHTDESTRTVQRAGAYAGRLEKPLIETAGQKRVVIAGTIEAKPKEALNLKRAVSAVKTDAVIAQRILTTHASEVGVQVEKASAQGEKAFDAIEKRITKLRERVTTPKGKTSQQAEHFNDFTADTTLDITHLSAPQVTEAIFTYPQEQTKTRFFPSSISPRAGQRAIQIGISKERTASASILSPATATSQLSALSLTSAPRVESSAAAISKSSQVSSTSQVSRLSSISQTTQVGQTSHVSQLSSTSQIAAVASPVRSDAFLNFEKTLLEEKPTFGSKKKKHAPGIDLFNVQVRRRGKFSQVNSIALPIDEAVKFGERVADTTAAASFRITNRLTGQPVSGTARAQLERFVKKEQYRASKRSSDVFVERNRFRINTPGEKAEIRPHFFSRKNAGGKVRL